MESLVAKTRREMQYWLQMPSIQTSTEIGKNDDGSGITQDVDVLLWWRDVGQARFPRILMVVKLETIMWAKWVFASYITIPAGRGDLHITNSRFKSISSSVSIDVYDC